MYIFNNKNVQERFNKVDTVIYSKVTKPGLIFRGDPAFVFFLLPIFIYPSALDWKEKGTISPSIMKNLRQSNTPYVFTMSKCKLMYLSMIVTFDVPTFLPGSNYIGTSCKTFASYIRRKSNNSLKQCAPKVFPFLAVQNSSIGDLVTHWLTDWLTD